MRARRALVTVSCSRARVLLQAQPAAAIPLDSVFRANLDALVEVMRSNNALGIAAPQIDWEARVFCIGQPSADGSGARSAAGESGGNVHTKESGVDHDPYAEAKAVPFQVWVNPRVASVPDGVEHSWFWESCLSVPGQLGWVRRPSRVVVEGCDEHGEPRAPIELSAYAARIFQHEVDHLDGVLYTERIDYSGGGVLLPEPFFDIQEEWDDELFAEYNVAPPGAAARRTVPGQLLCE